MTTRRLAFCICILATCGTSFAQPARDVEAVARRLYERYALGDLEGAMALWSPTAPNREAFRRRLSGILLVRCVEVRGIDVTRVDVNGDRAVADVTVSLAKWGRRSAFFQQQTELATLTFEHTADGWLLTGWRRQEEALADALQAAKSAGERESILAAQRRLVTPTLNEILGRRAIQLINQDQIPDAAILARLMETIAAELADVGGLARARGIDSIVFRKRKQWDLGESLRIAKESVLLAEASGDPDILAAALLRTGRVERWTEGAWFGQASYTRALDLRDDVEDGSIVAMAAGGVAEYYDMMDDHRGSLHYALLSRDLAAVNGDRNSQLNAELHIAGAYELDADYALALPHLERALSLAHAANLKGSVPAEALFDIAMCHLNLDHETAFLSAIKQAAAERGDAPEETSALAFSLLATYHLRRDDLRSAAIEAGEAVRLARTGFRSGILDGALIGLAAVKVRQGHPREVLALVRDIGGGFQRRALAGMSYRMLGRRAEADRAFREAVESSEDTLANFDERQSEIQFHTRIEPFVEWIDMLVEDGRFSRALDVAERAKGRALLHTLRGGHAAARAMMTEEERKREREIEERINALNSQQFNSPSRLPAVEAALGQARTDLQEYRTILYAKYPRLKSQESSVTTVTRAQIGELLGDRSSAFLEFVIGQKRTHVFLIRRSGTGVSVHCRTIPIARQRLTKKVNALVGALAAQDRLYSAPARELYQLLLAPFESELQGIRTLCVIPDGALWQLPFESLVQPDGRFFIERMAVFYAPSITVYGEMVRRDRSVRAPGAFLAFADPPIPLRGGRSVSAMKLRDAEYVPLPDAAREVETIAALFRAEPTKVYVGADALESRAKAESPRYAVIHFATHGVLDDHDPMFSHLVLTTTPGDRSEDGLLETWEMMQLDLHANLAVLSACETARGTIRNGEGMIGMSWALSVAGTSSTIVTQWKIASSTTAGLMVDFYRQWLGARPNTPFAKAEALRRARLHVLADPAHRHPFFWSAFVLIGSGS